MTNRQQRDTSRWKRATTRIWILLQRLTSIWTAIVASRTPSKTVWITRIIQTHLLIACKPTRLPSADCSYHAELQYSLPARLNDFSTLSILTANDCWLLRCYQPYYLPSGISDLNLKRPVSWYEKFDKFFIIVIVIRHRFSNHEKSIIVHYSQENWNKFNILLNKSFISFWFFFLPIESNVSSWTNASVGNDIEK